MRRIGVLLCVSGLLLVGCRAELHRRAPVSRPAPAFTNYVPAPPAQKLRVPAPRPAPEPKQARCLRVGGADLRVTGGIDARRWSCVVVHHAGNERATPDSMDRYHRETLGWERGLGYHFVIGNGAGYPDGQLYVGPRWKRQVAGAHCKTAAGRYFGGWRADNYFNEHGIGICLMGNLERQRPTPRQLQTLELLIATLVQETGMAAHAVYGHGEVTHRTACPGRQMRMASLRQAVVARLRDGGTEQPVTAGTPARAASR
jgi:hypothetical protein